MRTTNTEGNSSLIPETLEQMEKDTRFQEVQRSLRQKGQKQLTREERAARRRALSGIGSKSFIDNIAEHTRNSHLLHRDATTLQVNIGLFCNQACSHCHVESSPLRKNENMAEHHVDRCLHLLAHSTSVCTLDVTGGAPELNPHFRKLIRGARALGIEVIDRCNLTVLMESGQEDLADFLAEHKVRVVASLPCYSEETVDSQRGKGVFTRSIEALQLLNKKGYGKEGTGLKLELMYNPNGAFLPPSEATLEPAYRSELYKCYGIEFNNLLALANMPIKRFADYLARKGQMEEYMQLLVDNFNPSTLDGLMCLDTVNVDWQGRIFDCDFNAQLEIESEGAPTIFDIESLSELTNRRIQTDSHCFGCTAGSGSSCGGSLNG